MRSTKKITTIVILILFLSSSCFAAIGNEGERNAEINNDNYEYSDIKEKEIHLNFSKPEVVPHEDYYIVRVSETNHNSMVLFEKNPGRPVLPVKIKVFNFPFSTKIEEINYIKGKSTEEDIPGKFSFGKARNDALLYNKPINFDNVDESYPSDWISHKIAGGLNQGEHTTFLILRVYPVVYHQSKNKIEYIQNISINIKYKTPKQPVVNQKVYDLLIISPSEFENLLDPFVEHKESLGISTKIATVDEIKERTYWKGRDIQEKIKYYIKESILNWGIKYVLLVGGIEGQTFEWDLPVRYSHVVPYSEQEYPEKSFISDLYYADVFDGQANFSSWDSNNDGRFSVWNKSFIEEMDLYPDVYLGRLPCRNRFELRAMVNKIIEYEEDKCDE
ncbi:MAG: C25 family cysteine peptidase, partial [Candidatus Thermoplasmatota archaeon]